MPELEPANQPNINLPNPDSGGRSMFAKSLSGGLGYALPIKLAVDK
jgi:hypothetical protein